jgi:hypothetical protein
VRRRRRPALSPCSSRCGAGAGSSASWRSARCSAERSVRCCTSSSPTSPTWQRREPMPSYGCSGSTPPSAAG